jgi:2-amino-4-hydroxy-6-hydroxymethyldihydropteridine diphosphokinase
MNITYIILGSNLGDRLANLQKAKEMLETTGVILLNSTVYDTEPWGFVHKNSFFNQVITLQTNLTPFDLLKRIQEIELSLGRIREGVGYIARTIDIDILFYEDIIINTPELRIPHPAISERRFVLTPLCEIAPDLKHPESNKTIRQLLEECEDNLTVSRYL